jgi:hypothetical protein
MKVVNNGLTITINGAMGHFPKEFVISALEKQIPKKVNISLKGTTDWNTKCHCPNCRALISNGKYCYECGQALDWGEEE